MTYARAEWKAETLSIMPPIGESPMRTAAAGAFARISRLTNIELAECILATDAAACRDNLAYSARRSGVARRSSVGTGDRAARSHRLIADRVSPPAQREQGCAGLPHFAVEDVVGTRRDLNLRR